MNHFKIAVQKFKDGYNWAQSVLSAFADDYLIDQETALKIAMGFGGRIAKGGQVCGAFSPDVMLLGLKHGQGINDTEEKKESTYLKVQDFVEEYKTKNKSTICKEILNGIDLKTEKGRNRFEEKNYTDNICLKCVENSTLIPQKYLY